MWLYFGNIQKTKHENMILIKQTEGNYTPKMEKQITSTKIVSLSPKGLEIITN